MEQDLLSVIDNLVKCEYALPPGELEEMLVLVREVATSDTVVGTPYDKNQLAQRHNLVKAVSVLFQTRGSTFERILNVME